MTLMSTHRGPVGPALLAAIRARRAALAAAPPAPAPVARAQVAAATPAPAPVARPPVVAATPTPASAPKPELPPPPAPFSPAAAAALYAERQQVTRQPASIASAPWLAPRMPRAHLRRRPARRLDGLTRPRCTRAALKTSAAPSTGASRAPRAHGREGRCRSR
jgi:hypothetical protein